MQVSSSFLPSLPPSLPPFVHFFWSLKSSIRILPCLVENRTRYVHLSLPPSLPPFLLPPSPSSTSDGKRRLPSPSLPLQARRLTAPTHPPSPPPFLPPSLQTQLDQRWKAQAASPFSAASGKTEEATSKEGDTMKRMFLETNPILLVVTLIVSLEGGREGGREGGTGDVCGTHKRYSPLPPSLPPSIPP